MSVTLNQVLAALRKANSGVNTLQRRVNAIDNAGIIRHLFSDGVFDTSGSGAQYGFQIANSGMDLFCSKTGTVTSGDISEALAYGYYCAIDDSSGGPFATIAAGDATNPRNDIVWANRFKIGVSQGTPAASPADPSIPSDAIPICRVLVPAGEIDGTGLVLADLREFTGVTAFEASTTNTQSITGTLATVQFDTVERDEHGDYDDSTYTFTAPVEGWYSCSANIMLKSQSAWSFAQIKMLVNTIVARISNMPFPPNQNITLQISGNVYLSRGDNVHIEVAQYSGNSVTLNPAVGANRFGIFRIF